MPVNDEPFTLQVLSAQGEVIYSARLGATAQDTQLDVTPEQLALCAGWTMGVLCSDLPPAAPADRLRTIQELPPAQRRVIEFGRLSRLLEALDIGEVLTDSEIGKEAGVAGDPDFISKADVLNTKILQAIAADPRRETALAYQLGQSIWKTGFPPADTAAHLPGDDAARAALLRGLARSRISKIQGSLAALSTRFPPHAAAVVAGSMGRWSDFAEIVLGNPHSGAVDQAKVMRTYLLRQTDVWLIFLAGVDTTAGLRGSVRVSRKVLRRYGPLLLGTAAILGAVLYVTATYASGVTKVVAPIVAVGASLGISARGIGSVIGTLVSRELKQPIFRQGEEEAMVWAITTLPPVSLPAHAKWKLRRTGVEPPASLGGP